MGVRMGEGEREGLSVWVGVGEVGVEGCDGGL